MASTALDIKSPSVRRAIIVCALGYFIDVFDIQLFAVLRVPSLTDLGVAADQLSAIGGSILNAQMLGMVLGAFLWGWIGDRFGRVKALYGSILIYSLGTLDCSFVQSVEWYGILRFITGFGLAGETGAAVTLVSELMSRQKRGWGVTLIGCLGSMGPVFAILISVFVPWRTTYIIAGFMGFLLLVLRMRLVEPALFQSVSAKPDSRGWLKFLMQMRPLKIFTCCVLAGFPTAYLWFLLNFFSAELSHAVLEPDAVFNQKLCLSLFYLGTSIGTMCSGAISQALCSRKKAVALYLFVGALVSAGYLMLGPQLKMPVELFYALYFILGCMGGGWLMITFIACEHFGTNIRATTAISVANLLRGLTIPMIIIFQFLQTQMSISNAAALIGAVLYVFAFPALTQLRETHGLDLDYVERLEKPRSQA